MEDLQRIAVLMPRSDVHTRGIFAGITRYARPLRAWQIHMGLPYTNILHDLRRWKPQGIIATIPHAGDEKRFAAMGVPLVNCSSNLVGSKMNRVITDNRAVGRLAAEYFQSRGFRHLAFCGESEMGASYTRYEAFADHARASVHQSPCSRSNVCTLTSVRCLFSTQKSAEEVRLREIRRLFS